MPIQVRFRRRLPTIGRFLRLGHHGHLGQPLGFVVFLCAATTMGLPSSRLVVTQTRSNVLHHAVKLLAIASLSLQTGLIDLRLSPLSLHLLQPRLVLGLESLLKNFIAGINHDRRHRNDDTV
jgi:hypothetical protein